MIVGHPLEVGGEAGLGLRLAVEREGGGLGDGLEQPATDLVEEGEIELAFGGEMLVQNGFGDTGRVGHVVHGRAVEALPGEDLEPDSEELFPASGSREASRHGYPMVTRAAPA